MNMAFSISSKNLFVTNRRLCYSIISYLRSKYIFSTLSQNSETSVSQNLKTIQFPKSVQPLVIQSADQILSAIHPQLTSIESVSALKALRMHTLFKNSEPISYKDDKNFQLLCYKFENSCLNLKPNLLVSGLRSLLEIGVPSNSNCVLKAEQSVLNNIHLFSAFNIIVCLYFHHKFMTNDLQKEVVSLLIRELCKKSSDITSNSELLMLMHFIHIFNKEDLKKIQTRIIELIPSLNVYEICKMFCVSAEKSNRNICILNALSFHFCQKRELPDLKVILDLLYSLKKLNFTNLKLLSYLSNGIIDEIPSVTQPSIISGLLSVCGHLKWKNIEILNSCSEWIANNIQTCRTKEFVSFILTMAILNHNTPEVAATLKAILPFLTLENVQSSDVWLDVTWSLAILGVVDKEILLGVLSPEFYKPLISDSDFKTTTNKLKLMNLKAVLKLHHPECIFGCELHLEPENIPQNSDIENSRKHVIRILSNFIPKDKYLSICQTTDMGIFIDAEFILNKAMKPMLLSDFGILSKPTECKSLPKEAHRIALLILFYKDFPLNSHTPTGYIDLVQKLLSAHGYTVVMIPYGEFIKIPTEVKKAKYLFNEIMAATKKKL